MERLDSFDHHGCDALSDVRPQLRYGAVLQRDRPLILRGEALLTWLPPYPYQPALAVLFIPLSLLPAMLQRLVWYVICVGCSVVVVRLTEAIAERLYPGATTRGQNLFWLRTIMLMPAEHMLDV